jgi:hypothetical protein
MTKNVVFLHGKSQPIGHFRRIGTRGHRQITPLSRVPQTSRAERFLDKELGVTERTARQAAKLKVADEGLAEVLGRGRERLERCMPCWMR